MWQQTVGVSGPSGGERRRPRWLDRLVAGYIPFVLPEGSTPGTRGEVPPLERSGWIRWALVALAVAAAVVSGVLSEPTSCRDLLPVGCAPDPSFPIAMGLILASLLLLWRSPLWAAATAGAFVVAAALYDTTTSTLAFSVYTLGCVGYAVYVATIHARQRAVLDAQTSYVPTRGMRAAPFRLGFWSLTGLLIAALCIVGIGVCAAFYALALRADADHAERAVQVTATVTGTTEDADVLVRLPTPLPDGSTTLTLPETSDVYEVGDPMRVTVDPDDPAWAFPTAEPPDRTYWLFFITLLGFCVPALLGPQVGGLWRQRRVLATAQPRGLPVTWRRLDEHVAFVDERSRVWAELRVPPAHWPGWMPGVTSPPAGEDADPTEPEAPRQGWLVGNLSDDGGVALVTDTAEVLPGLGRLQFLPASMTVDEWTLDPDDEGDLGTPIDDLVDDQTVPVTLPYVDRPGTAARVLGWALLLTAPVVVAAWIAIDPLDALSYILALVLPIAMVVYGTGLVVKGHLITATHVTIWGTFTSVELPIGAVDEVRVEEGRIVVLVSTSLDDGDGGFIEIHRAPDPVGLAAAADAARVTARATQTIVPGGFAFNERATPGRGLVHFFAGVGACLVTLAVGTILTSL